MKIKTSKKIFSPGEYPVKLVSVSEGLSEKIGTPFFQCRFENDEGYITSERFYYNENKPESHTYIANFFKVVAGVNDTDDVEVDTDELIGKDLIIVVGESNYVVRETGEERKINVVLSWKSKDGLLSSASNTVNTDKKLINEDESDTNLPF